MTVISLHDMFDAVATYVRGGVSADGGLSLMLINGPVLIPLAVAAFFYPMEAALFGAATAAAVTTAALALWRAGAVTPPTPGQVGQHEAPL